MSSCVKPIRPRETSPVVLLHCFDSSCLEWRCAYPLLEEAGLEVWAVDVLGWGFSDLESLPSCNAKTKRYHLYQLWKTHIKRPMVLVGPSLGGAVAIDFAVNHPEAVKKLVLINPSVYGGLGMMANLPKTVAYAVVSLLKSIPLRLYAKQLVFGQMPFTRSLDWMNVDRLHCLLPWWEDATVNYMLSGGYNVVNQIKQVKQKALVISGECDNIVSCKFVMELHCELPNSILREIPGCGHIPHVQNPKAVAKLIADFALEPLASSQKMSLCTIWKKYFVEVRNYNWQMEYVRCCVGILLQRTQIELGNCKWVDLNENQLVDQRLEPRNLNTVGLLGYPNEFNFNKNGRATDLIHEMSVGKL